MPMNIGDIIDYLTEGYWENAGESPHKFNVRPGGTLTVNITALTSEGQQLARWALDSWSNVTGINFRFVRHDNAQIIFDDNGRDAFTNHFTTRDGFTSQAYINVSTAWLDTYGAGMDSYSFSTYLHEIGHALGLGHPGPYNGGHPDYRTDTIWTLDSWQISVMSYIDQTRNPSLEASYATPVTPMIADIWAIHQLYGRPASVNSGDTVYGYGADTGTYMDQYFRAWTGQGNPFSNVNLRDVSQPAFVDLGRDNDLDLVLLNRDRSAFLIFENRGTAANPDYVYSEAINWNGRVQDYEFIDMDGNGVVESALVADNRGAWLVTGIDRPSTAQVVQLLSGNYTGKFDVADMDGDRDLDIVEIFGNRVYYRENIGTPTQPYLTDRVHIYTANHSVRDFALVDMDNDRDFDLVAVDRSGGIYAYENAGTPYNVVLGRVFYFDDPLESSRYGEFPSTTVRDFTFADLDSDNDFDFIVIDNDNNIQYFENTGSAREFYFTPANFNRSTTLTIYDTDGFDRLDLSTDIYDQYIDLNPGYVSHVYGLRGNLIIAWDTIIEEAAAGRGNDVVIGNEADNALFGGLGNDLLIGGPGDDLFGGDPGNDVLVGGTGDDLLGGGFGSDMFVFSPEDGFGVDTIIDFSRAHDFIDLSAFDDIHSVRDFDIDIGDFWDETVIGFDENRADTLIDLTGHGGGQIVLMGYTETIKDVDFIFSDDVAIA